MKVLFNFSVAGFSNTYVVGPENGGDAVIIDPGSMNVPLLTAIENNRYYIRHALLTHGHGSHADGLRTLGKIYDFGIIAGSDQVKQYACRKVSGGEVLTLGEVEAKVISISGHSTDSVVYHIGRWLFTGDTLCAGTVGSTANRYAEKILIGELTTKILSLNGDCLIFPGHGSPTTLEIERKTNPSFYASESR